MINYTKYAKMILGLDPWFFPQKKCPKMNFGFKDNWTVATAGINSKSVVYSFGIGEDISFDLGLIKKFGLAVHAFDPTPRSLNWLRQQNVTKKFIIHPWGIADYDGKAFFEPPLKKDYVSYKKSFSKSKDNLELSVYKLKTIMKKLGTEHIDILKMDIEGFEYQVLKNILKEKINIKQILVEFHHRFDSFSKKDTILAINNLNKKGYKIFNISDYGREYSFVKSKNN